jgi:hypothetical protein
VTARTYPNKPSTPTPVVQLAVPDELLATGRASVGPLALVGSRDWLESTECTSTGELKMKYIADRKKAAR